MNVSETIFREIFKQLPDYVDSNGKDFTIRYEWGNQNDLLLYLNTIKGNKYPLVWLVSGEQTVNKVTNTITRDCKFIISANSLNPTNRNPTVWDKEFVNCLNPLLKNVLTSLERSGVTEIVGEHKEYRDANYTEEDLLKATDFWNVIVLDITVKIKTDRCLTNKIKF